MKKVLMFLTCSICLALQLQAQNEMISVCGEAKGVLAAQYAVFHVLIDDADCSARFPDLQSKQKRYAELTKEFQVPATDNELLESTTKRVDNYEGAKDVHAAKYKLTLRNSANFMMFLMSLDQEVPGSSFSIVSVEFGDNNAAREAILAKAHADAKHRADVLAKLSNCKVGNIQSIKEERVDEGGNILESLFMADKRYKKDENAFSYTQLFPDFNILIRIDFELIPN